VGKGFFWGIVLLVIALICFLAATGMGGQDYAQQGAYCIAGFFVLAALPFFIISLVKHTTSRRENAAAKHQQQTPTQSRARSGVSLPQALPEQQGKNTPRQEGR